MDIKKITIENCHKYLEEFYNVPQFQPTNQLICQQCNVDCIVIDDCFFSCSVCGETDIDNPIFVATCEEWTPAPCLYKRRHYYRSKLNMLCCVKNCYSNAYKKVVEELKLEENDFDDIFDLMDWLKSKKLSKFYKNIYNLYFDVKKQKLIELSSQQIEMLSNQFVELECKFKMVKDKYKRKNFPSYNTTIFYLLKLNKIKGYEHIVLARNHNVLYKLLKKL